MDVRQPKTNLSWPVFMLFFRTLSFFAVGFAMVGLFSLMGVGNPWKEITRWWTYQVIITNVFCFLLLRQLTRKESGRLSDLYRFSKSKLKRDAIITLALLVPSGIIGYYGVVAAGLVLYGGTPPDFMMQSLPLLAAILSVILFPLSNALMETTTYFGYAFERLAKSNVPVWIALLAASFCLALQHTGIPLFLDGKYFVWRIASFLPFALFAGFIYYKIRRLAPLVVLHFFADLPLAIITLVLSVQP